MTPQETDPDMPMSIQESLAEAWVSSGLLQGQRHLLKEVTIIFITSTTVWPQVKQQGGNSPAHQKNIGLKIY